MSDVLPPVPPRRATDRALIAVVAIVALTLLAGEALYLGTESATVSVIVAALTAALAAALVRRNGGSGNGGTPH